MKTISLTVAGMSCGHCVKAVSDALKKVPGVVTFDVSLENKKADVTFDELITDKNKIISAIEETGFEVTE